MTGFLHFSCLRYSILCVLIFSIILFHKINTFQSHHSKSINASKVLIYHIIDNELWGEVDGSYLQGIFSCPSTNIKHCQIYSSDSKSDFLETVAKKYMNHQLHGFSSSNVNALPLTVSMYNIHTWKALQHSTWPTPPDICSLPTHFTIAESEESFGRFGHIFRDSFKFFDGNSTTSPYSSVQRTYIGKFNESQFLPHIEHNKLIRGVAYVASTCHRPTKTMNREGFVKSLRQFIRLDGLGKCSHTRTIPEGVKLFKGSNALETLQLKQQTISKYMFYLAIENTIEPGYVTEKVADALIAGTVPIYVGSSEDCKKLLPIIPNAIIYYSDFHYNMTRLAAYLHHLTINSTAYELHRSWRRSFDGMKLSHLLHTSWPCRLCEWASHKAQTQGIPLRLKNCTSA